MKPVDVPPGNPICSTDKRICYAPVSNDKLALGDGTYRVLAGHATVAIGPSGDRANSYTDAFKACSDICTKQGDNCKSFNVLTTSEGDVNDCQPTWVCRYSDKFFTSSEYTQSGLPYSQVWNVYSRCDYGQTDCYLSSTRAWASCDMLGYGIQFAPRLTGYGGTQTADFTTETHIKITSGFILGLSTKCNGYTATLLYGQDDHITLESPGESSGDVDSLADGQAP